jgi:hypothetical protein
MLITAAKGVVRFSVSIPQNRNSLPISTQVSHQQRRAEKPGSPLCVLQPTPVST